MNTISMHGYAARTVPGTSGIRSWRQAAPRGIAAFAAVAVVVAGAALGGCSGTMPAPVGLTAAPATSVVYNSAASFSVGVIPTRAPPVRIGDALGFTLSASATDYGHLYLLNASGGVLVLAENLPLAGGAQTMFPSPGGGFTFRASPPAGVERVLLLVTRQPFKGFAGGAAASGPVQLAERAHDFIVNLNAATGRLPKRGWSLAETRIEIVP